MCRSLNTFTKVGYDQTADLNLTVQCILETAIVILRVNMRRKIGQGATSSPDL